MFQDIRKINENFEVPTSMLAAITGQASEDVGHLTPGLNYADAKISCGDGYDKFACPYLYA
jgi:hypothetical protein